MSNTIKERLRAAAEARGDDLLARLLVEAALALEQREAEAAEATRERDCANRIKSAEKEILLQEIQSHMKTKKELAVTNTLLVERQKVLDAVPKCPKYGECVPFAVAWIQEAMQKLGGSL